jgi:hypothetical protein
MSRIMVRATESVSCDNSAIFGTGVSPENIIFYTKREIKNITALLDSLRSTK